MMSTARKQAGFTLLELMITVAIIAILSSIAYASYNNQVMRSRRAAAAACLQEQAQFMERFYTTNMSYTGAPNPSACGSGVAGHYGTPTLVSTATTYTLSIAPTANGTQARNDTQCGTLTINQAGVRGASGTSSGTPQDCW